MIERPTCETCPFAVEGKNGEDTVYFCHGYPPIAILTNERLNGMFPPVNPKNVGCSLHPDWKVKVKVKRKVKV